MRETTAPHLRYIQVCEHHRENGEKCCFPEGQALREKLKAEIKAMKLSGRVRVMRTGCFDCCAKGPNVFIMPEKTWFQEVTLQDIPEIIRKATSDLPKNT